MKPYNKLLELLTLYIVGVIAVAIVLAWSLFAAWMIFIGLTMLVFFLSFRGIFPSPVRSEIAQQSFADTTVKRTIRELESTIARGFEGGDLQAQRMTLETLERAFAGKVRRRLGIDETELKLLTRDPDNLTSILGEIELSQLLSNGLMPDVTLWDLVRLSNLISKVEDWGR